MGHTPSTTGVRIAYVSVIREFDPEITREQVRAEFDRWLAQHDAEVAANTTLGIAHRLDTDDPRIGEQLVRFEDEWRKEARGEKDGAA